MTLLQAIILGIIQGLTEFLPVSSSAHLVLTPYLLGWKIPPQEAFIFDVLVQVASLVAVIAYFWTDLMTILRAWLAGLLQRKPFTDPQARLGWLLILATIPAGLTGLLIKDLVEQAFASPLATALFLFVTAGMLTAAEYFSRQQREMEQLNWKDALWIGLAQAVAIFPGISRSGATISGGMARGFKRPASARFAFLMSIPIMLAAGLLASLDMVKVSGEMSILPVFIPGLLASAIVSYFAIRWLLKYLAQHSLYIFAIYCAALGSLVLFIHLVR
jgi:undecaprenyl-diphosphatase